MLLAELVDFFFFINHLSFVPRFMSVTVPAVLVLLFRSLTSTQMHLFISTYFHQCAEYVKIIMCKKCILYLYRLEY